MSARDMTARLFNIQRFSLHDGAGIRTDAFFQGCNLRCGWCANPESQQVGDAPGSREYTVEKLAQELVKDKPFFDRSGGGVTLTGGEPLLQADFVLALCERLHELGVKVAVETAACVPGEVFRRAAPAFDLIHIDLKHYDEEEHLRGTGAGLRRILENIRFALGSGVETILRIPVIPGYNDLDRDARGFAALLKELGAREVHLLPFHQMGESKYEKMGVPYAFAGKAQKHEEDLEGFAALLRDAGLTLQIGG
jgi:pyruvate formate lyase activating enzyme